MKRFWGGILTLFQALDFDSALFSKQRERKAILNTYKEYVISCLESIVSKFNKLVWRRLVSQWVTKWAIEKLFFQTRKLKNPVEHLEKINPMCRDTIYVYVSSNFASIANVRYHFSSQLLSERIRFRLNFKNALGKQTREEKVDFFWIVMNYNY